jgi:hypothetical protein
VPKIGICFLTRIPGDSYTEKHEPSKALGEANIKSILKEISGENLSGDDSQHNKRSSLDRENGKILNKHEELETDTI